jgi:hypothetical protein
MLLVRSLYAWPMQKKTAYSIIFKNDIGRSGIYSDRNTDIRCYIGKRRQRDYYIVRKMGF